MSNVLDIFEERGFVEQMTDRAELSKALDAPTTCYIGFDPTASSFHVGSLGAVIARGQAGEGRFRPDMDPIDVHMAIAALGMFNVTNQYTFGTLFQRAMGAKGDVSESAPHGGRHDPELARPRVNSLARQLQSTSRSKS